MLLSGDVTLLAGPKTGNTSVGDVDGVYTNVRFNGPSGITLSSDNSYLLVADAYNNKIKKVITSSGTVSTLVGPIASASSSTGSTNGVGTNVRFNQPVAVKLSSDNSFAVITENGNLIRKLIMSTLLVTLLAGTISAGVTAGTDGTGTSAKFDSPSDLCFSTDSSYVLIVDSGNHRIRKLTLTTGVVSPFVGGVWTSGMNNGVGTNARFNSPSGIAMIPSGNYALVTDTGNTLIRKIVLNTLVVTTIAGTISSSFSDVVDGSGTNAKFFNSYGITFSSDSSYVMIAEGSYRLRKMVIATSAVTTFAGQQSSGDSDGTGTNAMFTNPVGVCIFSDLGWVIVSDQANNKLKIIAALGK